MYVPFNSPLHRRITSDQRRRPVQDLVAGAARGVEDGGVERAGERVLAVGRHGVDCDALLGWGAYTTLGSRSFHRREKLGEVDLEEEAEDECAEGVNEG